MRHSETALRGALYLIGHKLLDNPVGVPCLSVMARHNNCLHLKNGNLGVAISLTECDGVKILDITITRNDNTTLWLIVPYAVATTWIKQPVDNTTLHKPYVDKAMEQNKLDALEMAV